MWQASALHEDWNTVYIYISSHYTMFYWDLPSFPSFISFARMTWCAFCQQVTRCHDFRGLRGRGSPSHGGSCLAVRSFPHGRPGCAAVCHRAPGEEQHCHAGSWIDRWVRGLGVLGGSRAGQGRCSHLVECPFISGRSTHPPTKTKGNVKHKVTIHILKHSIKANWS